MRSLPLNLLIRFILDYANNHIKLKFGANSKLRFDFDLAPRRLDNIFGDHESKSHSILVQTNFVIKFSKSLEQSCQLVLFNTDAGILHLEAKDLFGWVLVEHAGLLPIETGEESLLVVVALVAFQEDVALGSELHRISNQVDEDLLHPLRVRAYHLWKAMSDHLLHYDALLSHLVSKHVHGIMHQRMQVEQLFS